MRRVSNAVLDEQPETAPPQSGRRSRGRRVAAVEAERFARAMIDALEDILRAERLGR